MSTPHYKGKEAIQHVAAVQAQGIIKSTECHGAETPGSILFAADSAREMAVGIVLLSLFLQACHFASLELFWLAILFAFSWSLWKGGRSAWLAWSGLEKLHRILSEERWEIQHNRAQEREELAVIYANKGFKGKLLEEVLDVLMADEDRLLQVMVREELGLSLEMYEHPLKQGLGAFLGGIISGAVIILFYFLFPSFGLFLGAIAVLSAASALSAYLEGNQITSAIIWNIGLGGLVFGTTYFLYQFFVLQGWLV